MRYVFRFGFALALGLALMAGCSDENGEGGSGGMAGAGGMAGTGGTAGTGLCEGVVCDADEDCLWGNCYALDCSLVEDDTACAAPEEFEWVPGLCSGDGCLPECEVLEQGGACNREDGIGVCSDSSCEARCENDDDCSDYKDCTSDTCLSNGLCESVAVQDGSPCAGGTCEGGACVLESQVLPCTEQGIRNAAAAGDGPYTFDCDGLQTIVTAAVITIDTDVVLDGEGLVKLDGSNEHQLFAVAEGVVAALQGFTLTRGAENGALYNAGTLMLANSTASNSSGWGLDNDGVMTVVNCTISGTTGNMGIPVASAQILNQGSLILINSTLSGTDGAAALASEGETVVRRSLIQGSCALLERPLTSEGYNVESPGDTCDFDPDGTDLVNVTAEQLKLGPLRDNGGPTMTHALGAGSVAIDRIRQEDCVDADGAQLTTDQRGEPRPETGGTMCDVGAFEVQP
jgi:hypothetical protein